jgi:hypothetical protein
LTARVVEGADGHSLETCRHAPRTHGACACGRPRNRRGSSTA